VYSIDGIPLHNPAYSWRVKQATKPLTPQSHTLTDFNASGRDGTIQVRGYIATPTVTVVVTTGGTWLEGLRRLFRLGSVLTVTADGSKQATCELVAFTVDTLHTVADGLYQVTAVLRLPNVFWRDVSQATYGPTTITTSGQSVTVFGPSTAPVRDALISVGGAITGLTVQGGYGTYFGYPPAIPAGTYLTFDAKSGRAWTGSVAFAETTEVTGNITNGPGPYYLELVQASSNPAQTGCPVVVTGSSISGAAISVKGYGRYDR
jgi:hypothetical protein